MVWLNSLNNDVENSNNYVYSEKPCLVDLCERASQPEHRGRGDFELALETQP